jgi:cupin 2 domain-containing protein
LTEAIDNLFEALPDASSGEEFRTLLESGKFKLIRIVSTGQATPDGEWYDQDEAEWVVVLKTRAGLRFEDEADERILGAGDFVDIAAHRRHRVTWTDEEGPTIWLALHYEA